jgi:multiple antibiotic resistance protein
MSGHEILLAFAVATFAGIFILVNPIGNIPLYLGLTEGYDRELKLRVIKRVVLVASITLVVFALIGGYIFIIFHTSRHAFRIAGGLVILSIAFSMMRGDQAKPEKPDQDGDVAIAPDAVGVVPLGIPLYAGPGALCQVMCMTAGATEPVFDFAKLSVVLLSILATMGVAYVLLLRADWVASRFGRTGTMAFTRILGFILGAIAVQILLTGVVGAYLEYFVLVPP